MKNITNPLKSAMIELLSQFGRTNEALGYLSKFSTTEPHRFAIIKIGGGVLTDNLDDIVKSVSFMQKLDLTPILVHGAGPQLDKALVENNIKTKKVDGLRVTDEKVIKYVRQVMYDESHKLIDALEAHNIKTRAFHHGIFECSYLDQEKYGFVGKPTTLNTENVIRAAKAGSVPIITPLGETEGGQMMNINADTATQILARNIQPRKIVFLTPSGGIWDKKGHIIPAINLATDYDHLMAQVWIKGGMKIKLREIKSLLENLPNQSSVSITSGDCLTRELFTHKGAGTLVRKGEALSTENSLLEDLEPTARALLEECFKRPLNKHYLKVLPIKQVIWSKSRRAMAIIIEGKDGISYLDKFAVTPEAQGEGLGAALWAEIIKNHPSLYWRSRTNNAINNWYIGKADTMVRQKGWLILSYGIENKDILDAIKIDALSRPVGWGDKKSLGEI